ncbi:tRNA pseudouridine(38-40) synthase TruA [Marinicella gelatinilytica]|uniref:tRNA pseudouridine(38-40) synthase TruA n=1 Tax=Marinicella gelatinilytica TaxID=2996017 RepID=UPI002260A7D9|nr:tRNA pseudouridine(38-40) synthase TruA [Marinicella gelatinilytica]MCX7546046.1 tRNA pseudouridine(38-40) synthase TruA [Marinicella gelatinilytica]
MMRIACGVEYDGSPFYGFQRQKQEPTVQQCLEQAISEVANHDVTLICCGRTDTGVSAAMQVIHFDTVASRTPRQWLLGINSSLHKAISVLWVQPVSDDFHARFSAISRSYQYRISNRSVRPALNRHYLTWQRKPLNHVHMNEAIQCILGTHDFSAFRSSQCQSKQPIKTVSYAAVSRNRDQVVIDVTASGFLHHMIRNLAGTLMTIGKGEQPVSWMAEVLQSRDRKQAGMTAAANGLRFINVTYPEQFKLPIMDDYES